MIDVEVRDGIAIVWLDRPPVNALDAELLRDIVKTFQAVEDSDAGAVVLTGRESAFSAGADLFSVLEGGPRLHPRVCFLQSVNPDSGE